MFDMESTMLISSSVDLKFQTWPSDEGYEIVYVPTTSSKITSLSLSKDSTYVAYLSENGRPEIISLKDKDHIKMVHAVSAISEVSAVKFQHKTKRIMGIGTTASQVVLYDTKNKAINKVLPNAPSSVTHLDFNIKDELLATCCQNGSTVVFNVPNGKVSQIFELSNPVKPTALRFHPMETNTFAVASEDGTLVMWDAIAMKKFFFAHNHSASVLGVTLSCSSDLAVTVGYDYKFCIHDLNIRECVFRSALNQPLTAVDMTADGVHLAIGTEDGQMFIYDIRNLLRPVVTWKPHNNIITNILFEHPPYEVQDLHRSSSRSTTLSEENVYQSEILKPTTLKTSNNEKCPLFDEKLSKARLNNSKKSEAEQIKELKQYVVEVLQKHAQELQRHLGSHMSNLLGFIDDELIKMEAQMKERWNMLTTATTKLDITQEGFYSGTMSTTNDETQPPIP